MTERATATVDHDGTHFIPWSEVTYVSDQDHTLATGRIAHITADRLQVCIDSGGHLVLMRGEAQKQPSGETYARYRRITVRRPEEDR